MKDMDNVKMIHEEAQRIIEEFQNNTNGKDAFIIAAVNTDLMSTTCALEGNGNAFEMLILDIMVKNPNFHIVLRGALESYDRVKPDDIILN